MIIVSFGISILVSLISGRKFCGKICPFGLIQDLIYKIPFPVKIKRFTGDKYIRYLKYALLIPFLLAGHDLNNESESMLTVRIIMMIFCILIFILISRAFCKYLCPFAFAFAIGNKVPFKKYRVDITKCTKCNKCVKKCKMDIIPYKEINSFECVYCGKCKKICPNNVICTNTPFAKNGKHAEIKK